LNGQITCKSHGQVHGEKSTSHNSQREKVKIEFMRNSEVEKQNNINVVQKNSSTRLWGAGNS